MIIQYQDPRLFDLFEGDKLFMIQTNEIHVVSEVRLVTKQIAFEGGWSYAPYDDIVRGSVLIRKVDIDI